MCVWPIAMGDEDESEIYLDLQALTVRKQEDTTSYNIQLNLVL